MYKLIDAGHIDWSKSIHNTGTDGCYIKTKLFENGSEKYIKLSNFNGVYGFTGYESVNEVIVGRLGSILGISVLKQDLRKLLVSIDETQYVTYACASESYKKKNEMRISAGDMYRRFKGKSETPLDTFTRLRFRDFIDSMFVFDYITISRDRHESNIEFLFRNGAVRHAPLFDNGMTFLAPIQRDIPETAFHKRVVSFEEFRDVPVNNFIGYGSLQSNLNLVSKPVMVRKLRKEDKRRLFYNMHEVLPDYYIDKIWSIICYRYSYLRKVGLIVEV